ncbi:MAG: hypothetical protein QW041_00285 [Candidatus Pacearchaeota archaeon]
MKTDKYDEEPNTALAAKAEIKHMVQTVLYRPEPVPYTPKIVITPREKSEEEKLIELIIQRF